MFSQACVIPFVHRGEGGGLHPGSLHLGTLHPGGVCIQGVLHPGVWQTPPRYYGIEVNERHPTCVSEICVCCSFQVECEFENRSAGTESMRTRIYEKLRDIS